MGTTMRHNQLVSTPTTSFGLQSSTKTSEKQFTLHSSQKLHSSVQTGRCRLVLLEWFKQISNIKIVQCPEIGRTARFSKRINRLI